MDSSVLVFGEQILKAQDLDPVYNYLSTRILDNDFQKGQLERWLLVYSMFYNVGVANYLSQFKDFVFWDEVCFNLQRWPRGEERRHFRGAQAATSVKFMGQYAPESIVQHWYKVPEFNAVKEAVQLIPIYGPWIAFKMADMGERVLRLPIDFSNCTLGIYKEPRQGAALCLYGDEHHEVTEKDINEVIDYILDNLNVKGLLAPPWNDRPLNVQEAETILCKWKSHKHGHYPIGKDIEAVKKALQWKP